MDDNEIFLFLKKRPRYTEEHVREIAQRCTDDSIPFCRACGDWHLPNEDHSENNWETF